MSWLRTPPGRANQSIKVRGGHGRVVPDTRKCVGRKQFAAMLDFPDYGFLRRTLKVGVFESDNMESAAGRVEWLDGGHDGPAIAHGGQHADLRVGRSAGFQRDVVSCHRDLVPRAANVHNGDAPGIGGKH